MGAGMPLVLLGMRTMAMDMARKDENDWAF
jgi:hypothetical protein